MPPRVKRTWGGWAGRLAATLPGIFVVLPLLVIARPLEGQASGEEVFQATCAACHTLSTDRLVGPGLAGVLDNRDHEWLISFITEPDRMIASGDSIATRLLAEYVVPMPNVGTTRAQAEAVLDFIAGGGGGGEVAVSQPAAAETGREAPAPPAGEDEIGLGRELFQGPVRFANGGPTCSACHDAMHPYVMGGGTLATNLTDVFTRIGGPGVRAIIENPPFPVMRQAYAEMPLTESEVAGLLAFLSQAEGQMPMPMRRARGVGVMLLTAGVGGSLIMLGLFSLIWRGRRKGSVHQALFDRQVESI